MKARQVLFFFLGVFALMAMLWLAVPADGVPVGPVNIRFASYERALRDASERTVDVDSVLTGVANRFKMKNDTLQFYRRFFYENPDRIFLPGDEYTYFDSFFREAETARKAGKTVRVLHYGIAGQGVGDLLRQRRAAGCQGRLMVYLGQNLCRLA